MTEQSSQNQEGANNASNTTTPNSSYEQFAQEEIDKLTKEIEEANKKIVSSEVAETIRKEKEVAKKEAEVEFAKNQKIKELEEQLKKEKEQKELFEKSAAAQLEALKTKLDSLISAKAVANTENPFKKENDVKPQFSLDKLTEEQVNDIEYNSFIAFMEDKSKIRK
jgi:hypothetical protein